MSGPFAWPILCAMVAIVIAVPIWLSWDGEALPRLPYPALYRSSWTTALTCCGAILFVILVWVLAVLLGELFGLIGLTALRRLLGREWVVFLLTGAAFGGGIALLRDRSAMIDVAQRAIATVLIVLAPVLAVGLILFLAALPFTGLAPLWDATRATTPVLLCCIGGALLLVGVAIGDGVESDAHHPAIRASVMALAGAILPLAVIAAISTGLRIHQHGLTPDRLWALTFVAVASAYGLAYAWTLIHQPAALTTNIPHSNTRLAITVAALAILLATPLVPFGRIAASDQIARLQRGTVAADTFDWTALRFDFGPAGVAALRRLASTGETAAIRTAATDALARKERWAHAVEPEQVTADRLTILPRGATIPPALRRQLTDYYACFAYDRCAVLLQPGGDEAVIVNGARVNVWRRAESGAWVTVERSRFANTPADQAALARGEVEVRTVAKRQVFVDGKPVDTPFD